MVDRHVSSCTTDVLLMESNEADKQPKEVYEQLLATFSREGQWQRPPWPPWAIRLINSFYQLFKSSEIENETVNGKEMKLKPWNVKTVTCFMFLSKHLSFELSCLILMPKWKVQFQVVLSKVNAAMKFFLFLLGYMKLNI